MNGRSLGLRALNASLQKSLNPARPACCRMVRMAFQAGDQVIQTENDYVTAVIPATQHCMLLERNLAYTGITRGKRLLVLIGQKKVLGMAVRNDGQQRWHSGLMASLKGGRAAAYANPNCALGTAPA